MSDAISIAVITAKGKRTNLEVQRWTEWVTGRSLVYLEKPRSPSVLSVLVLVAAAAAAAATNSSSK